jgi:aromatic ring-opening dioxygenase LigB subunit
MPIAAAAVVPHPPLLLPEVGRGDPQELAALRSACLRAVDATMAGADALLLVGGGPTLAMAVPGAAGSFAPYGVGVRVELPAAGLDLDLDRIAGALPEARPAGPLHELPLSLAVAAWLLGESGRNVPRLAAITVPASLDATGAAALGRELARAVSSAGRVGLLVMADLSARRTARAPASLHPAAAAFDRQVGRAVRDGAPARLLALDAELATALVVGGLAPLQVLAGALEQTGAPRGAVLYEDAPYGVGYLVGVLSPP